MNKVAKNKENQKDNKKTAKKQFMETRKRADGTTEYIIKESPANTLLGKVLVILILGGMVVLPVIALIISLIQSI